MSLDLTKAIEIQHEVAKKLMEKHNNKDGQVKPVSSEKVIQLEQDNLRLTDMLQTEYIANKLLKKDNHKLRNLNRELLSINQTLIDSNQTMRGHLDASRAHSGDYKADNIRILHNIIEQNLEDSGLDKESHLYKLLEEVKNSKPSLPKANFTTSLTMQSSREKQKTKRQEVEGAKELAHSLKIDINRLKGFQNLYKGKNTTVSEKNKGGDDDPKAWSFVQDQEKQENNFEAKRDNIETSHILDAI